MSAPCQLYLADLEMSDSIAVDGQELRFLRLLFVMPTLAGINRFASSSGIRRRRVVGRAVRIAGRVRREFECDVFRNRKGESPSDLAVAPHPR
jgi:hypothetical protein